MNAELKFDGGYRERIGLPGGERVRLRLIQQDDKARLLAGFRQLSAESRARRFLGGKQVLSEAELRYFTEIDQVDHFVIGAVELDARGRECDGVAVGRFVRLSGEPRCAEVAIAIADRLQGKGLGLLLLKRLAEAAQERGFERLRFEYLADNIGMHRLIQDAFDNMFLLMHSAFEDSLRMQFDWGLGAMYQALDAVCAQTRYWNASPCGWLPRMDAHERPD